MPSFREEAETLRLGLMMGLILPSEIIAWADRVVGELATPPIEVIDVAVAGSQPTLDLAHLLKRVPGPADLTTSAHHILDILWSHRVDDALELEAIVDMLWVYSIEADVCEAERQAASNFRHEYEGLAYYGTQESLSDGVRRFLAEYAPESGNVA